MTSRAPVYFGYEYLHPVIEIARGRFGAGLLLVYDAKKCDHVVAKRVANKNEESFERQVFFHIRASSHVSVVRFLGLLPSSTSCFQYAIEYVPDGNLRQLVVADVGLPDEPSKYIFRQLQRCLTYLHDELGIVHGSLRPDHILMASVNRCIVKVSNFSHAYPIGSRVKMNTGRPTGRPVPWKKHLTRLKSFLINRTSSLKVTPGGRFRPRRSVDLGNNNNSTCESCKSTYGNKPRRFSIASAHPVVTKNTKEVEIHEYTMDDFLEEMDAEIFSQAFTAPELVNATRYVASPASDNWSLVMLAIYCITGGTPWETAAVGNRKYTAFLHSSQRSKSFTPQLNERAKDHKTFTLAKFRSRSLSSLVETIRKRTNSDRAMSPLFEKKMTEILKQPANQRFLSRNFLKITNDIKDDSYCLVDHCLDFQTYNGDTSRKYLHVNTLLLTTSNFMNLKVNFFDSNTAFETLPYAVCHHGLKEFHRSASCCVFYRLEIEFSAGQFNAHTH